MTKNPQNRPPRKDKKKRQVVVHKHSFQGGAQELLDRLDVFRKDFAEKHNANTVDLQRIALEVDQFRQLVVQEVNQARSIDLSLSNALSHVDVNTLALTKVCKQLMFRTEIMGAKMGLLELRLGKLEGKEKPEELESFAESDLDEIRRRTDEGYVELVRQAFAEVQAERAEEEAEKERLRKEAEAQREEFERQQREQAAQAERNAAEAQVAGDLLRQAEDKNGIRGPSFSGGQGAPIPDGAIVFGG